MSRADDSREISWTPEIAPPCISSTLFNLVDDAADGLGIDRKPAVLPQQLQTKWRNCVRGLQLIVMIPDGEGIGLYRGVYRGFVLAHVHRGAQHQLCGPVPGQAVINICRILPVR